MKETRLTVKALVNGKLEDRSRTLYETVHGPMFTSLLGLPLFPWTPAIGFALGDVNANNFRYLNHFIKTNQAQSVREYHAIQERYQGIPWVNSLAADSKGEAYYTMNGAIPNVPEREGEPVPDHARPRDRQRARPADPRRVALRLHVGAGIRARRTRDCCRTRACPTASGATTCTTETTATGSPTRRAPLEGFDRIVGIERAEVTPRTRLGLVMMRDRLAGRDGLPGRRFNLSILERVALGNRQYLGELWRDRIVEICRANPTINGVDVSAACDVLARWNLRDDLDAPGALLFRRFAARAYPATQSLPTGTEGSAELGDRGFSEPFDPNRPVDTPTGLQDSNKVRSALAERGHRPARRGAPAEHLAEAGPEGPRRGHAHPRRARRAGRVPGDQHLVERQGPEPGGPRVELHHGRALPGRRLPGAVEHLRHLRAVREPQLAPPHRLHARLLRQALEPPAVLPERGAGRPHDRDHHLRRQQLHAARRAALARGSSRARGGGVRIGLRRARRARVRVDMLRVTRRGLRRVRTFRRSKSFRVRGLPAGTYVARYRIKTANGRTDERRKGFRVSGGRVLPHQDLLPQRLRLRPAPVARLAGRARPRPAHLPARPHGPRLAAHPARQAHREAGEAAHPPGRAHLPRPAAEAAARARTACASARCRRAGSAREVDAALQCRR